MFPVWLSFKGGKGMATTLGVMWGLAWPVGPIGCAAYDMGRLLGEGIAQADHLTRAGIADGLRRAKQLPATSGYEGTLMGFGVMEHAALKGHYLVLREWKDNRSVQVIR